MASAPLPERSREYGIGKEIAGKVYVHRQYEQVFGADMVHAKQHIPPGFDYDIVKYNRRRQCYSFIQSKNFNTADEPTVGDSLLVRADGTTRSLKRKVDPMVYHHKWLFVDDDYTGFNVEESKQRSRKWLALSGIDRSRIGRHSYWTQHVLPKLEITD